MRSLTTIIMAAGQSTRLKSQKSKVLHPVCGVPMLQYSLDLAKSLSSSKSLLIVGHGKEQIEELYQNEATVHFVFQKQRLGTAHAVKIACEQSSNLKGDVLILSGDVPLLRKESLKQFLKIFRKTQADLSVMSTIMAYPYSYGRILRNQDAQITGIVEEKNASEAQKLINEVNTGIYLVKGELLLSLLKQVKKNPVKGEYYLTDIIALALQAKHRVQAHILSDESEVLGANTRAKLAHINQIMRARIVSRWLKLGVGMEDPARTYIDASVKLSEDVFLEAGVHLIGKTKIGRNSYLEQGVRIKDAKIGEGVLIKAHSYLEDCELKNKVEAGPMARIRPGSILEEQSKIGNFVELKKTHMGKGAKAGHLSYLGDAKIGAHVNVGAGNITCNYDGKNKFKTVVGEGTFLGSDVQLVAPVKIGKSAYVGAGTTVTKDVPAYSLAVSRVPQRNIKDWVKRKKV